ncbi:transmembrane protein 176B [Gracilinanus agilis]|uniref:transmembrane protein 176B n=1 Tax=Gracilinanus agilis TaxID=191870 RepID=UPI001CFD6108|nr:transmembrane protein 176B [Gracilinanus agilis]
MSASMVKVDGMQVMEGDSQPTQINIHIHQESALTKLLETGCSFLKPRIYSQSKRVLQAQLALGVSLILLGVSSCSLGIILYFGPWIPLRTTGCAFWAGAVAVLAGAVAIIYEKRQNNCWGGVAALLALISISTALAAVVLCSYSFADTPFFFNDMRRICERMPVETPTYSWHYNNVKAEDCERTLDIMLQLFQGIQAMLLAICAMMLLMSLASLGVGLRHMCCQNSEFQAEEASEWKLLGGESLPPSPYKEKSSGTINM